MPALTNYSNKTTKHGNIVILNNILYDIKCPKLTNYVNRYGMDFNINNKPRKKIKKEQGYITY